MLMYDIICQKRDGLQLSDEEISFWIREYTQGNIPDYQCAALLMAGVIRGFSEEETAAMVEAMLHSGDVVDLGDIPGIKVDKHSTGGVGDKTSLVLMPIAAAAGLKVAKMSGRGLGHTGGTLDKLEAIPGCHTDLALDCFKQQVREIGIAIMGQSKELVPADKKLYALRDATATVDSIPLIAASIMSKKLAMGADVLALDVKFGSGAFMRQLEDARALAQMMLALAKKAGIKASALLTSMEQPLGLAIGNALEIREVIEVLTGGGPADLRELSLALAGELIFLADQAATLSEARQIAEKCLNSGAAWQKFQAMVAAQGGDTNFDHSPVAKRVVDYKTAAAGYICAIDARQIGLAALALGAGRRKKEDSVNPAAGIILQHKIGDRVEQGETLAKMHTDDESSLAEATLLLDSAFSFSAEPPQQFPLISEELG